MEKHKYKKNTKTKKRESGDGQKKEKEKKKKEERRRRRRRRNSCRGWSVHQHYLIRRPTAIRPPSHHQTGSDRLVLFFFYIFNFIVRIRFCFLVCFWIIWDVFWEWSKVRSACSSQQLCFFFFCFSVFLFFLGSDSKGTVRSGLITVLRTVWLNRGSNGFLFFWHRPVLKLKEPWWREVHGFSGRTVRSGPGFKTLVSSLMGILFLFWV